MSQANTLKYQNVRAFENDAKQNDRRICIVSFTLWLWYYRNYLRTYLFGMYCIHLLERYLYYYVYMPHIPYTLHSIQYRVHPIQIDNGKTLSENLKLFFWTNVHSIDSIEKRACALNPIFVQSFYMCCAVLETYVIVQTEFMKCA